MRKDSGFRMKEDDIKQMLETIKKYPTFLANSTYTHMVPRGGFKMIRTEMGLTQTELGILLGITIKHISNIENPKRHESPSLVTCIAMLAIWQLEKEDIDFKNWASCTT